MQDNAQAIADMKKYLVGLAAIDPLLIISWQEGHDSHPGDEPVPQILRIVLPGQGTFGVFEVRGLIRGGLITVLHALGVGGMMGANAVRWHGKELRARYSPQTQSFLVQ